jgi:hypothetical protein
MHGGDARRQRLEKGHGLRIGQHRDEGWDGFGICQPVSERAQQVCTTPSRITWGHGQPLPYPMEPEWNVSSEQCNHVCLLAMRACWWMQQCISSTFFVTMARYHAVEDLDAWRPEYKHVAPRQIPVTEGGRYIGG